MVIDSAHGPSMGIRSRLLIMLALVLAIYQSAREGREVLLEGAVAQ